MKTIIGLAGVKTSGKSTVANMVKEFVNNAGESALADKLKNVCAEVFGLQRIQFDSQNLKELPLEAPITLSMEHIEDILSKFGVSMTKELNEKYKNVTGILLDSPRKIAQIVGTEVLRATGNEDIHCDNVQLHEGVTIISDLRFPNEFSYFSGRDDIKFIPIYVQRNEAEKHVTKDSHPSETSVFLFSDKCIRVDNNGSLQNTERQIRNILEEKLFGNQVVGE